MLRTRMLMPVLLVLYACSADRLTGVAAQDAVRQYQAGTVRLRPVTTPGRNALILLDGLEVARESLRTMDPASIHSVEVIKSAAAVAQYGERARDGVILIQTKRGVVPPAR